MNRKRPETRNKRRIQTEIMIAASQEKIWQVLMDFDRYPEWNPFIKSISGKAERGGQLEVVIQPKGKKANIFKPVVQQITISEYFEWLGSLPLNMFNGRHYFKLEGVSD
jgi:uncharacterized membrane protein